MKNQFLLIALTVLLSTLNLFAAPRFNTDEQVNVWALKGLALYKHPGSGSTKLLTIPYGKTVNVLSSKTDTLKAGQIKLTNVAVRSTVKGYWIKVSYNGNEGYVFDGYLSKMPCLRNGVNGREELDVYFKRNYKTLTAKTVRGKYDGEETTYYFNGRVILKKGYSDGCFDSEVHLSNVSDTDVKLFESIYFIGADAAEDIKVKKLKTGKEYVITWYSCT